MRHMMTWKSAMTAGALLAASSAVAGDAIYGNDFTTRTSQGAIPEMGVWHVAQPYLNAEGNVVQQQIISYCSAETAAAKARHGYGFDLYGNHRYVYFHDFFWDDINSSGHASFDGWFHPNWRTGSDSSESGGYSNLWMHRLGINASDPENPCLWFYYDTATPRQGYALQSLHNTFTNGQLKIQVDMRAPLIWRSSSPRHIMIFPVYETFMHSEVWGGELHTGEVSPGKFGFRCGGTKGREYRTYPLYYDARKAREGTTTQLGNNYSSDGATEKNCYWFRFEVTYDLDTAHFAGTVKSLDASWITGLYSNETKIAAFNALPHPTFDTACLAKPLKSSSFENALWIGCETNATGTLTTDLPALWAEKGGISGLGFFVGRLAGTETLNLQADANNHTNNVFVDNLRVSWKAPDATDFAVCYENDFKTRKYRTLSAAAATQGKYAAKTEAVSERDTFDGYEATENIGTDNILPTISSKSVVGEPGVDGWRRHYFASKNSYNPPVGIVADTASVPGKGGNVLAFGWNGSYTLMSQILGTTVTSGKVTLQADVFLPGEWAKYTYLEDCNRAMFVLGSQAMHTAKTSDYPADFVASFGYSKVQSGTEGSYTYAWRPIKGAYGKATDLTETATTSTEPDKNNWCRYTITADLDAKTYDVNVNKLGTDSVAFGGATPDDSTVFSATGIAFDNNVTEIGSFAIYGYGYGNGVTSDAKNKRVLVDNIIITHDGTTLYSNNFSTRTRNMTAPKATGYLAYEYNHDDGPDGWIRQDGVGDAAAYASATVRDDDGNAFVSLGRERASGEETRYGHSIGTSITNRNFRFRVDIRPPKHFAAMDGEASVTLGGRSLEQLQTREYDADKLLAFGFKGTATATTAGLTDAGALFVGDATTTLSTALDTTHWYRFDVRSNVDRNTCRVKVYDLGTTHPTASSRGALVANVADIVPAKALSNGFSAFYLTARNVGFTEGETGIDSLQMLVDNITSIPQKDHPSVLPSGDMISQPTVTCQWSIA